MFQTELCPGTSKLIHTDLFIQFVSGLNDGTDSSDAISFLKSLVRSIVAVGMLAERAPSTMLRIEVSIGGSSGRVVPAVIRSIIIVGATA